MRRRRPRPLLLIALLLLAGAVVNVTVAWVLVGAPDSWTPGGPSERYQDGAVGEKWAEEATHRLRAPRRLSEGAGSRFERRGAGWTTYFVLLSNDQETWFRVGTAGGWPRRSLIAVQSKRFAGHPDAELRPIPPSFIAPRGLLPNERWFHASRNCVPLSPLAAGFAINTLFYTAILALPLSVFPIRRRLRTRRGRCLKCGYDLAGLVSADAAAPCPECGAAR